MSGRSKWKIERTTSLIYFALFLGLFTTAVLEKLPPIYSMVIQIEDDLPGIYRSDFPKLGVMDNNWRAYFRLNIHYGFKLFLRADFLQKL